MIDGWCLFKKNVGTHLLKDGCVFLPWKQKWHDGTILFLYKYCNM